MSIPRARINLTVRELCGFIGRALMPMDNIAERRRIEELETAFARRYGSDYESVIFCRARMAFYHLLRSLDLAQGSEVMISAIHVADFVNIIRLAGLTPVAVDLKPNSFEIDVSDMAEKLTDKTSVVLVTHLSGYATNMREICSFTEKNKLFLVEDCSQAFTATFDGKPLGTFGQAAIFSLSLLKSVCTLFGGVVITRDTSLIEKLRKAESQLPNARRLPLITEATKNLILKLFLARSFFSVFIFPLLRLASKSIDALSRYQKANKTVSLRSMLPPEFLVRFSGCQASLGLNQLTRLDGMENTRAKMGLALRELVEKSSPNVLPKTARKDGNCFWLFPLLSNNSDRLKSRMAKHGVDSSGMLLSVLSKEDAFEEFGFSCPNAEGIRDRTLFVPMYATLETRDVERIARSISESDPPANEDGKKPEENTPE